MSVAGPLLEISGLSTVFPTDAGTVRAVDGIDITVAAGECVGVVGESGSGKSVTFQSVLGLVRPPGRIVAGCIRFEDLVLTELAEPQLRRIRGRDIAVTMQDALTALNPVLTVGSQIAEVLAVHGEARSREEQHRKSLELLRLVGIPAPEARLKQYPHELSGGMRQRVMIAVALACRPKLLIADEPTSALDVTIQAQILDLIADLRRRLGMAVVLITHDLGIVAQRCDRVVVMYAGQIVEEGPTRQVIRDPRHPYTLGLIEALPRLSELDRPIRPIEGRVPELLEPPAQCRFLPRCHRAAAACRVPVGLSAIGDGRAVRCVRPLEPRGAA